MTFRLPSERIGWLGLLPIPFHFENLPRCFIQIHVVEFQCLVVVDTLGRSRLSANFIQNSALKPCGNDLRFYLHAVSIGDLCNPGVVFAFA